MKALLSILMLLPLSLAAAPVAQLYHDHCAICHGWDRLGLSGPALLPENLARLRKNIALEVMREGRPATQMEGFKHKLSEDDLSALADYIYSAPAHLPPMGMAEIQASRLIHHPQDSLATRPQFDADPLNLFVVVETGDHHATILDGDKLEPLHRFQTRFALHGGPKYSPDGRFVYFASRDGWVTQFDLYNFKNVAEIRVGINTRNIALSADGRYVIAANYLPHTLVILEARELVPLHVIDVIDTHATSSRVSAVYTAPPRQSFIAALKDVPEVWEIPYDGDFAVRRISLDDVLDDFFFDQEYHYIIGAARHGGGQVIDLSAGKKIAALDLPGMPHLGSGISWKYEDKWILATPNLKTSEISIIDMHTWQVITKLDTLGPGFFMRSHDDSPYAWSDVFFGEHKDAMHIIDKRNLSIVKTVRPVAGKTAAHIEFDRYGKYALLSIWEKDGAIIVYDAKTLEEVKRLPMNKPSGKYNVYNKINYVSGTSH
jgi:cytochrome c553